MPRLFPDYICADCAARLARGQAQKYAAWHNDRCDVCEAYTSVAEPRDFGHLKPNWREIVMGKELP